MVLVLRDEQALVAADAVVGREDVRDRVAGHLAPGWARPGRSPARRPPCRRRACGISSGSTSTSVTLAGSTPAAVSVCAQDVLPVVGGDAHLLAHEVRGLAGCRNRPGRRSPAGGIWNAAMTATAGLPGDDHVRCSANEVMAKVAAPFSTWSRAGLPGPALEDGHVEVLVVVEAFGLGHVVADELGLVEPVELQGDLVSGRPPPQPATARRRRRRRQRDAAEPPATTVPAAARPAPSTARAFIPPTSRGWPWTPPRCGWRRPAS